MLKHTINTSQCIFQLKFILFKKICKSVLFSEVKLDQKWKNDGLSWTKTPDRKKGNFHKLEREKPKLVSTPDLGISRKPLRYSVDVSKISGGMTHPFFQFIRTSKTSDIVLYFDVTANCRFTFNTHLDCYKLCSNLRFTFYV